MSSQNSAIAFLNDVVDETKGHFVENFHVTFSTSLRLSTTTTGKQVIHFCLPSGNLIASSCELAELLSLSEKEREKFHPSIRKTIQSFINSKNVKPKAKVILAQAKK